MLNARAIAVQGVGYGALLTSVHGLLPAADTTRRRRGAPPIYYPPIDEDREADAAPLDVLPPVQPPAPIPERRPIGPGAPVPEPKPVTLLGLTPRSMPEAWQTEDEEEAAVLLLMLH